MSVLNILFINSGIHHKNIHGLRLCPNIHIDYLDHIDQCPRPQAYDFVYFPCQPFDVSTYPDTRFVFGPHMSILPNEEQIRRIQGKNSLYIQPSSWVVDLWKSFPCCQELQMKSVPFSVDVNHFAPDKPLKERTEVTVYYKCRKPEELAQVETLLKERGFSYRVFHYDHRYHEHEFLDHLKKSQFGIWVGRHESQGFALEESLACGVPLLVWDVTSLNQEYGSQYPDYPATCIPYWDETCGEVFYEGSQLPATFDVFLSKLYDYKPRDYIVQHLSAEACEKKWMSLFA